MCYDTGNGTFSVKKVWTVKAFLRTLLHYLLAAALGYVLAYLCLLFARQGEMNVADELFYLFLHPTSGGLFLRILFPIMWFVGFAYITYVFATSGAERAVFLNAMLHKPYVYAEERRDYYQSREWIPALAAALVAAAILPVYNRYLPWYVLYPLKAALFFFLRRAFLAYGRYIWCAERLGGLEAKEE